MIGISCKKRCSTSCCFIPFINSAGAIAFNVAESPRQMVSPPAMVGAMEPFLKYTVTGVLVVDVQESFDTTST